VNQAQPNILLILTDQQNVNTLGCYGSTALTPNIDHLANQGVTFTQHYVTSPLCVPSRGSLWTSRYPHQTGVMVNDEARPIALPDEAITIGDVLKEAGYRNGYFGKWHLGRDHSPQHGFDEWWAHLRGSYEQDLAETGALYLDPLKDRLAQRQDVPFELAHDTETTNRALAFIEDTRKGSSPFFCVVSMRAPHDPYVGPFDDAYDPAAIPLPSTAWNNLDRKPQTQNRGAPRQWFDQLVGLQRTPDSESRLQQIIARYWGLVRLVDINVGRLLSAIAENDLDDNTIILFLSDHGDMMGAHSLFAKGLFMYEESTRIPWIVRWPGHIPAARRVDALTSMVDVVPTILELVRVGQPTSMVGVSARQLWDYGYNRRTAVFMEVYESYGNWGPVLSIRTERYKYSWYLGDEDELYDLLEDPNETMNLANDRRQRDLIFGLRTQISAWLRESGDPSLSSLLAISRGQVVDGSLDT